MADRLSAGPAAMTGSGGSRPTGDDEVLITELRVHGVGGAGPSDILNRNDVVAEDADRTAGFYRTTDERPPCRRLAYSWGGMNSRKASRAFWTLLLPFSFVNVSGWMIEPPRQATAESEHRMNRGERFAADLIARLARALTSDRLRTGQRWLIHLVALVVTVMYVQWIALLSVNVLAYQCGSKPACYGSRSWLTFLDQPFFIDHPGRRIVLGAAVPLALLGLFFVLSWRSRRHYVDWRPSDRRTAVTARVWYPVERTLDSRAFWHQSNFHRGLARLHVAATLGVLGGTIGYGVSQLGRVFDIPRAWWGGTIVTCASASVAAIAAATVGAMLRQGGSVRFGSRRRRRFGLITQQVFRSSCVLMAAVLALTWTVSVPDQSIQDPANQAMDLWGFGWAPLLLLGIGMAALLAATIFQLLRWALDRQVDFGQFIVPCVFLPVSILRNEWSLFAAACVVATGNIVRHYRMPTDGATPERVAGLRRFTGNGGLILAIAIGIGLAGATLGQDWWLVAAGLALVAATFQWVTTETREVFRWFGTGAVAAVGLLGLVGILAGVGIRLIDMLAGVGRDVTLRAPALFEWMALAAFVATVAAWLAGAIYGIQTWVLHGPGWRSAAVDELGADSPAVPEVVRWKTLVETARASDVVVTVYAMLMFFAAVAGIVHLGLNVGVMQWPDVGVPSSLRGWVTLATWAEVAYVVAAYFAVRSALRDEGWRRRLGTIWDVASFWPNRYHPFAPPAYAARAVPELAAKISATIAADPRKAFILSGHSQGSVLAFAAVALLDDAEASRVVLVTHGSPLGPFYRRFFPGYFSKQQFQAIDRKLLGTDVMSDGSWVNLFRSTDPIAGAIGGDRRPDRELLRHVAASIPKSLDELPDLCLDDPCTASLDYRGPEVRAHSDYDRDPCMERLVGALTSELAERAPTRSTATASAGTTDC